jgi:hypothetical protein
MDVSAIAAKILAEAAIWRHGDISLSRKGTRRIADAYGRHGFLCWGNAARPDERGQRGRREHSRARDDRRVDRRRGGQQVLGSVASFAGPLVSIASGFMRGTNVTIDPTRTARRVRRDTRPTRREVGRVRTCNFV